MSFVSIGGVEGVLRFRDETAAGIASFNRNLKSASDNLAKTGRDMVEVGSTLSTRVTAPIVALGTTVVTTGTRFQSSFTGVRKTVSDAGDEFGDLADKLRDLATGEDPIPIDVNKLNAIAESAGQLGIETPNLESFTRTMANLNETTDLTAESAASMSAQFGNISDMPQTEYERFGSTVVDLGNNFATTESKVLGMGLRIAGAGEQVGFAEHQTLALATAISSVGIEVEAGGSAISRVIADMALSVASGGEGLEQIAQVAGMTGAEFKRAFEQDAASALDAFVIGLGRMGDAGGPTLQTLDELGWSGIRVRDVLLRLSGAGDLLTRTLETGETAWEDNVALANEAALRYGTFESKLTIAWNRLKDVAITIGLSLLPVLSNMLNTVAPIISVLADFADQFANASIGVQTTVTVVSALVAGVGPAVYVLGQMAIAAGALGISFTGLTTAIGATWSALMGPVGLVAAGTALLLSWQPTRDLLVDMGSLLVSAFVVPFQNAVNVLSSVWERSESLRAKLGELAGIIGGVLLSGN